MLGLIFETNLLIFAILTVFGRQFARISGAEEVILAIFGVSGTKTANPEFTKKLLKNYQKLPKTYSQNTPKLPKSYLEIPGQLSAQAPTGQNSSAQLWGTQPNPNKPNSLQGSSVDCTNYRRHCLEFSRASKHIHGVSEQPIVCMWDGFTATWLDKMANSHGPVIWPCIVL